MYKNPKTKILLKSMFLTLIVSLSINALAVWAPPTSAPTDPGNTPAPVNVGSALQFKNGSLKVLGFRVEGGANAYFDGNVAIGNLAPTTKLDVTGTVKMTGFQLGSSATAGYVLTTNASGVGTWQAAAGGTNPTTTTGDMIYSNPGSTLIRLGIGSAGQVLTVSGGLPTWGTITGTAFGSQSANTFFAAPNGAAGNPSFRLMVAADLPTIPLNKLATGTNGQVVTMVAGTPAWANPTGGLPSGTSGQTIRYDNTNTAVANSMLYNNGTNIGINTQTPGARLAILGNLNVGTSYANIAGQANGIIVEGNVGVGTSSPATKLDVNGTAKMTGFQLGSTATAGHVLITNASGVGTWQSITAAGGMVNPMTTTGDMIYSNPGSAPVRLGIGSAGQVLTISGGLPTWQTPIAGGIGGSGTLNYIPKFSPNGTTLANSALFQEATTNDIGINTTTPASKLAVNGNSSIGATYATSAAPSSGLIVEGTVGIGTSSPTGTGIKLHVNGIGGTNVNGIRISHPAQLKDWDLLVGGSVNSFAGDFAIADAGTALFVIQDTTGNVGISDTTPASLLTVGSGDVFQVNSSGDIIKIKNITYSWPSAQGSSGQVLTNNGTGGLSWTTVAGGGGPGTGTVNYVTKWATSSTLSNTSLLYDNGTNVGVNTTAASNKLGVNQSVSTTPATFSTYGFGLMNAGIVNLTLGADASNAYIQSWSSKPLVINAQGNNVGVGNSSPSEKLDVSGNIRFSGALMPNNLPGVAGLVLTSQGPGVPPTWTGVFPAPSAAAGATMRNTAVGVNWVGDTNLYNDGASIGIGTTAPGQKLSVAGSLGIREGGASPTFYTAFTGGDQSGNITYTLPTAGATTNGQVLSSTNTGVLSWVTPTSSNPTTTIGDMIYANGSGNPAPVTRLGIGAPGQVLTVSGGGIPSWAAPGSGADNLGNHIASQALQMSGFTINGNTSASGNLTLDSTTSATKGNIILNPSSGNVGIGDSTPASLLTVGNGDLFQVSSSGDPIRIKGITYSWPSAQGSSGQVLTNNGTGGLSWATVSGGGAVNSVSASNSTLTISPNTGNVLASLNLANANTWTATQTFSNGTTAAAFTGPVTLSSNFTQSGTGTLTTGSGAVTLNGNTTLGPGDTLALSGLTSGVITLRATNVTTGHILTLPSAQGSAGQVLTNDGTGNLSWTTVSGGGGPTALNDIGDATGTGFVSAGNTNQVWSWPTLAGATAFSILSNSTQANSGAGSDQVLLNVQLSGANVNAGQTTYSSYVTNTHTGSGSTNIAGYFSATGGTTNYGLWVNGYARFNSSMMLNSGTPLGSDGFAGDSVFTINAPSIASGRERLLYAKVEDSANYFSVINTTSTNGKFVPTFVGYAPDSAANQSAVYFDGRIPAATDTGTTPIIAFRVQQLDGATATANRPIVGFGSGASGNVMQFVVDNNGDLEMAAQNVVNQGGVRFLHDGRGGVTGDSVFLGGNAGTFNVTATNSDNTGIGDSSLSSLISTSVGGNTAVGSSSMVNNTSGGNNTAVGLQALNVNTTGMNNTAIGANANVTSGALSNATAIGSGASVNASNKIVLGNASAVTVGGYGGWTNYSDARLKENIVYKSDLGLNFILKLNPVSYNYKEDINKRRRDGLIAQDVQKVLKELNLEFSGLVVDDDKAKTLNLSYAELTIPLINSVKEQQAQIDALKMEIEKLKARQ